MGLLGEGMLLGRGPQGPLEAVLSPPSGFIGAALEPGHCEPWGEAKAPAGTPAPLTVTTHTQQ